MITIQSNIDEIIGDLNEELKKTEKEYSNTLKMIMSECLLEVVALVNAGLNVYGQAFIPYSQKYLQIRMKKGLRSTPNMQFTSDMINSLKVSKKGKFEYWLGVQGSDRNGVSNNEKLRKLENMKNYKLLFWSDRLTKIVDEYISQG